MAISSLDGYIAAAKQRLAFTKTASRTTVATGWFSLFDLAGNPGAGTLAGASTAAGVVPDDTVAGYPSVNSFGGGATGYLAKVEYGCSVATRIAIYDRLFVAGAYAFNAATTLASQPSYSGRVPGGTDYRGLEIWVEQVTAATGNQAVTATYTNAAGTTARTTGAVGIAAAPTLGRCWQLPLQAGDDGVTKLESITGTIATVGTFNVMVLRQLWGGRVRIANDGDVHDILRTGLPQIFDTSAIYVMVAADSTSSGVPDMMISVANG